MLTLLLATMIHAQAQNSNWVERKQIDKVQKALTKFYQDCGFYPESLKELFDAAANQKGCKKKWVPPLEETRENRDVVERLNYTSFGYHDYEISVRVYWTRPD